MREFPKVKVTIIPRDNSSSRHSKDKEQMPIIHYECVAKCPENSVEVFNRCWPSEQKQEEIDSENVSFFQILSQDLIMTWPGIGLVCVIALIFSYILLILFRYAIKYIIWIIYIGFIALVTLGALALWVLFLAAEGDSGEKTPILVGAILLSIFAVCSILLLIWFRKRINLVAALFKETSKSLIDVPTILFEPVLTFFALILAIAPFLYFAIIIETAGNLESGVAEDGKFQAKYVGNFGTLAARYLNLIAFIWFSQFIFGCQHFVIAGKFGFFIDTKGVTDFSFRNNLKMVFCS